MLDRSRPFGTIYPPHRGAMYEQDGHYFGPDGKRLDAPVESDSTPAEPSEAPRVEAVARRKPGPKPKVKVESDSTQAEPTVVSEQVAAQLGDA